MPELGEINYGRDIGKSRHRFIWHACVDCGKERWVHIKEGKSLSKRCNSCANRISSAGRIGAKTSNWKGGRTIDGFGYIRVRLQPDDFFYPMANNRGDILEHRLVMAQHLGRCLQSWEIVHHKGIRHIGIENKSDNLLDNLELTTLGSHTREHSKGYRDGYLKGLYDGHETRIKQLETRITLLEAENTLLKTDKFISIG